MTTTGVDSMAKECLGELDGAPARLPRARRRQIVDEVSAHIAEYRAQLSSSPTTRRACCKPSTGWGTLRQSLPRRSPKSARSRSDRPVAEETPSCRGCCRSAGSSR